MGPPRWNLTPALRVLGPGGRSLSAGKTTSTRLRTQGRPTKAGTRNLRKFIDLVPEMGKYFIFTSFFSLVLVSSEIFLQVSLLWTRLSAGQWDPRLIAFPKIVLLAECGTRDCLRPALWNRTAHGSSHEGVLSVSAAPRGGILGISGARGA